MKTAICTLVVALGLAAAFTMNALAEDKHAGHDHGKLSIGGEAPKFTLKDHTGKDVSLAEFNGKVVVLEWFNEECPFVKKHYTGGHMNKLASKYSEKGVVWLAINSGAKATQDGAAKVASDWKMDRPILLDNDGEVGHDYGATNTPHMFIIDTSGKLVYRGAIDSDKSDDASKVDGATNYVAKALDEVLAGKPVSQPETKAYGCSVKYAKK